MHRQVRDEDEINNVVYYHGRDAFIHRRKVDFKAEISYHSVFKEEKEMAHHGSAIRQWRRSLRRNAVNKRNKSALRKQIRKLRETIKSKDKKAVQELLPLTFSAIDKSIKKGAIHENTGNRYKSRLCRQAELISSPSAK